MTYDSEVGRKKYAYHRSHGLALVGLPRTGKGEVVEVLKDAYGEDKVWVPSTSKYLEQYLRDRYVDPDYQPTRKEKFEAGLFLQKEPNEDFFVKEFSRQAIPKLMSGDINLFVIDSLRRVREAWTAHLFFIRVLLLTRPLDQRIQSALANPRLDEQGGIREFLNQTLREHVEISKIARMPHVLTIENNGTKADLKRAVHDTLLKGTPYYAVI